MNKLTFLNGNTIELHYWFNDNTHTMDALVFNKCEAEFIAISKEIIDKLKLDVEIEVEALAPGGLRSWFKFKQKDLNALKVGVALYVITNVLGSPLTATLDELTRQIISKLFDNELVELQEEKEKLELELDLLKLKGEIEQLSSILDENKIKKKRSNYYEQINNCKKIDKLSITVVDDSKNNIFLSKDINKEDFSKFIIKSDDIEPEENENAIIEIISPVLKKGKYKWTGIYTGEVINFNMKSSEFKTLVQTGKVQFKNGSSINCHLIIKKNINAEGEVKISGYEVVLVNSYFDNEKPIETAEGKRKRRKKENNEKELTLF